MGKIGGKSRGYVSSLSPKHDAPGLLRTSRIFNFQADYMMLKSKKCPMVVMHEMRRDDSHSMPAFLSSLYIFYPVPSALHNDRDRKDPIEACIWTMMAVILFRFLPMVAIIAVTVQLLRQKSSCDCLIERLQSQQDSWYICERELSLQLQGYSSYSFVLRTEIKVQVISVYSPE